MRRPPAAIASLVGAPLAALFLLAATGGLALSDSGLAASDDVVRIGLPLLQGLRSVAAVLVVGALVVAGCCLPPDRPAEPLRLGSARRRVLDLAAVAALVWALAAAGLLGFTYADASSTAVLGEGFLEGSWFFAQQFEMGRYLLAEVVISGLVGIVSATARTVPAVGFAAALGVVGLWPMALTGHAAGTLRHDAAVDLQLLHWLGVAVWLGGLAAILSVHRALGAGLEVTLRRYSRLAGWCLVLVAASGALGAALRLGRWTALWSSYGGLLGVKVAALAVAVSLGWWQRDRLIERIGVGGGRVLLRVVALEVGVLTVAAGAGVALSRSAAPPPPGRPVPLTAAQAMLGRDLPQPLDAAAWFTSWNVNVLWLVLGVAMSAWYVAAVLALRQRGDRWPVLRTVCWLTGWALFVWATNGAPGAYDRVLFSMHMVQHMTIALGVPTFLALAAPITLALRTLPTRRDGSYGPREWLQRVLSSLPVVLLSHPVVAAGLVVVGLVAFYYSSAFELSLETHTGHTLMVLHFLGSGYLFATCLVGADPGIVRPAYPLRVLIVMLTFGAHALFSVSLMASSRLLAADWYGALGRTWGRSLADDQYLGASLGWALGDYPLAIMAGALVALWVQSDRRERRRLDRQADRDGGRELAEYNAYLTALSSRTSSSSARSVAAETGPTTRAATRPSRSTTSVVGTADAARAEPNDNTTAPESSETTES